jgi:hypothetical protein
MYIQNQTFQDEENLLEQLFDFSLGEASATIQEMTAAINDDVLANVAFQEYRKSLTDEEEIMELDEEERRIRLAEKLMEIYDSFEVANNQLLGVLGTDKTMLYTMQNF